MTITVRNTPTCVGKTKYLTPLQLLNWKHPHVRGEDRLADNLSESFLKHPHVRGEDC